MSQTIWLVRKGRIMSFQPSPGTDTDSGERRQPAYFGCGGSFAGHVRVNLVVLAVLVGVWALTGSDGVWPLWVALGMAAGLAFKALLRHRFFRTRTSTARRGGTPSDDA